MNRILFTGLVSTAFSLGFLGHSKACAEVSEAAQEKATYLTRSACIRGGYPSKELVLVRQALHANWRSSQSRPLHCAQIEFFVGDDDKIYDPSITYYSGNDQHDAECLEAVCWLTPIKAGQHYYDLSLGRFCLVFGDEYPETIQPCETAVETQKFLKDNPQKTGVIVAHKIPFTVLSRYPSLFTKAELATESNLMIIPPDGKQNEIKSDGMRYSVPGYVRVIRVASGKWNEFFAAHKNATKNEILEQARKTSPESCR